jgi:hypothetical protein
MPEWTISLLTAFGTIAGVAVLIWLSKKNDIAGKVEDARKSGHEAGQLQATLNTMSSNLVEIKADQTRIWQAIDAAKDRKCPCSQLTEIVQLKTLIQEYSNRLDRYETRGIQWDKDAARLETLLQQQQQQQQQDSLLRSQLMQAGSGRENAGKLEHGQ